LLGLETEESDGSSGFGLAATRLRSGRDDDQQRDEQEEDRETEGEPRDDFLAAAFFRLGEDIQTTTGDGTGRAFGFTTLKQTQNDQDESHDDEDDVIPLKHNFRAAPFGA